MDSDKNIILTGMPAVGKSTTGVLLAKIRCMPFLDTDILLQQKEKRLLPEIIRMEGISSFLKKEEDAILSLNLNGYVIATGGSVVYSEVAMQELRQHGIVVYLKVSFKVIEKRLKDLKSRGVVIHEGETLHSLYSERTPLYEKYADLTIDTSGKDIEQVLIELDSRIKS